MIDRLNDLLEKVEILLRAGNIDEAGRILKTIMDIDPYQSKARFLYGTYQLLIENPIEALNAFKIAASLDPSNPFIQNALGSSYLILNRPDYAIIHYDNVLLHEPKMYSALISRASAFLSIKNYGKAAADYELASEMNIDALYNYVELVVNLIKDNHYLDALRFADRIINKHPHFLPINALRGDILFGLHRYDEAISAYEAAILLNPNIVELHQNLAHTLLSNHQFDKALNVYNNAISNWPNETSLFIDKAELLRTLHRVEESYIYYCKALALDPKNSHALEGRAANFLEAGYLDLALKDYDLKAKLCNDPCNHLDIRGFIRRKMCDWSMISEEQEYMINNPDIIVSPFSTLSISNSEHLNTTRAVMASNNYPNKSNISLYKSKSRENKKITIGFVSSDFYDHATTHLICAVIENIDRSKFNVIGISIGEKKDDDYFRRISAAFDSFYAMYSYSDKSAIEKIISLDLDIALDLKGFTKENRMSLFAHRIAPIQINFLGYPGSLGAKFIDYIIADPIVIPAENRSAFTEHIIYLPHCYQPNDSKKEISSYVHSRSEIGLPSNGFIFCSFNNSYKILPDVFNAWLNILLATPQSVLWLIDDNEWAKKNLKDYAELNGVDSQRLIFSPRLPLKEHLARHKHADLVLDTLPYNSHTTASDALYVGVPIITCLGSTFASRVCGSLLNSVGLSELITHNLTDYVSTAVDLANNPDRLKEIKDRLDYSKAHSPLFDSMQYTTNLETAFEEAFKQYISGETPRHIFIHPHY
jgi:protein O-GlcNAc transferase